MDESCISNSKLEISDWTDYRTDWPVQFEISSFEFEMQDSSNFKISLLAPIYLLLRAGPERRFEVLLSVGLSAKGVVTGTDRLLVFGNGALVIST